MSKPNENGTEIVSFNDEPKNTWLWRTAKKRRKFTSCEEIFDADGDGGTYIHSVVRNTKSKRKRRILVGGKR